uniref:Uncharacterized protein n=1 Tax=Arundo donax TaxID=35708 RepID=A0A0A8ZH30_ARUDO
MAESSPPSSSRITARIKVSSVTTPHHIRHSKTASANAGTGTIPSSTRRARS